MKKEKNYKMSRVFGLAALIVALGGITVITTALTISGLANPAYAVEERGCIVYQTYPAQVSCSLPISSRTFSMV
jgi:hypothetical protein